MLSDESVLCSDVVDSEGGPTLGSILCYSVTIDSVVVGCVFWLSGSRMAVNSAVVVYMARLFTTGVEVGSA